MELETDADRREMLLALGGSTDIAVEGLKLSAALFVNEPRAVGFDNFTVNSDSPALYCLWSESIARGLHKGQSVRVPSEPHAFEIASIQNESGMALCDLRNP